MARIAAAVVISLVLAWAALIVVLVLARPDGTTVAGAARLVPDILRLVRRLAGDPALPRRARLTLWLLVGYLASPVDIVPDFVPVVGYADDAIVVALALRRVVRLAGPEAIDRYWTGTPAGRDVVRRLAGLPTLAGVEETPPNRWLTEAGDRSHAYDRRWEEAAAAGRNIHGEADLVERLGPASVLDAGCGTGRVAIELAARGIEVAGVDVDGSMLARARNKAPDLAWIHADLAEVDLGRTFDVVVMAGNVMIFLAPGTESRVVANLARHVAPGGSLVAGFSLEPGRLDLATYDAHAAAAGLVLADRWATWDEQPFAGGDYAVSVHRRPGAITVHRRPDGSP